MLKISNHLSIPDKYIQINAIRAQGAGGQNVNKLSSAIHLRFDILASDLPEYYQQCLLQLADQRISKQGVIIIKAQTHRTQEKNKQEALNRLASLIRSAIATKKKRRATKPTKGSQKRRLNSKKQRGQTKQLRKRVDI